MAQSRYYSSSAQPTVLTAGMTPSQTTAILQQVVGFPAVTPYVLAIGYGTSSEELVLVNSIAGTNLTDITRAFDGTAASSHGAGDAVRHVWCGADGNDARSHEGATAGVHGVAGTIVGTTDTQTLTNKTYSGGSVGGTFTGSATFSNNQTFAGEIIHSNLYRGTRALSSDSQMETRVTGDTNIRWYMNAAGAMRWGSGAATTDTILYRGAAGILQSDSLFKLTPTSTAIVDYLSANAPSGASTSANLINLTTNAGNRLFVRTTGHVSVNTSGNTAGIPLSIIAETGQTGNLIAAQVAATPTFTVTATGSTLMAAGKAVVDGNGVFTTYANNTKTPYTPVWSGLGTATVTGNTGWYYRFGKMILFSINAVTSGTGSGTANVQVTLPSTPDTTTDQEWVMRYGEASMGYAIYFTTGTGGVIDRLRIQDGGSVNRVSNLIGSFITTGQNISIEGWYLEA